jgi:UDP-N-acetylglucosamine--N-acetylmuramyl-(pentapeptide) pyrophosphoryl-undecaprenol N-acetylglucosamine transferase
VRVILTGGGTGGHLYPALAIAEEMRKLTPCELLYVGTRRGLEASVVPERGIPFRTVWIGGLKRGRIAANLAFPLKMAVSLVQSLALCARFKPDAAVGTGGYVSWPVITAASMLGCYTAVQEQNDRPGLVTRLLARRADAVHLSFASSARFFRRKDRLHVSGNPTRPDVEKPRTDELYGRFGLRPGRTTLLVFGGSQGARSLNEAFAAIAPSLLERTDVQLLWATGPRWHESVRPAAEALGGRVRTVPYLNDMGGAYAVADLVVCRSGAGAAAEIARLGKPAVFVPFPGAADGHQEANAAVMAAAGAAVMVKEGERFAERLEAEILSLASDAGRLRSLARNAAGFGRPDAARTIAGQIIEGASCRKK